VHSNAVTEIVPLTGNLCSTISSDKSWTLLDLASAKIFSRTSEAHPLQSAAVHADLSLLAVGNDQGDLSFWDLRIGRKIFKVKNAHGSLPVNSIDFNSYLVATGGGDQRVAIYDLRAKKNFRTMLAHQNSVSGVKWLSSDSLVSASLDGVLKLLSLRKGDQWEVASVELGEKIISMDLAKYDERTYVAAGCYDRTVRMWSFCTSSV
jgi:WD40 repeat protein